MRPSVRRPAANMQSYKKNSTSQNQNLRRHATTPPTPPTPRRHARNDAQRAQRAPRTYGTVLCSLVHISQQVQMPSKIRRCHFQSMSELGWNWCGTGMGLAFQLAGSLFFSSKVRDSSAAMALYHQ